MSLVDKAIALETVLHFHHSTRSGPLPVAELLRRASSLGSRVERADLGAIQALWPDGYALENSGDTEYISAPDLPAHYNERRKIVQKFAQVGAPQKACDWAPGALKTRAAPRRIVEGSVNFGRVSKRQGTLLERIRAKEAARKGETPEVKRRRAEQLLRSQLPAITSILHTLASASHRSFAMDDIVAKIAASLPTKMGASEIQAALHLLAQSMPSLCSVFTEGNIHVVQVTPPRTNVKCNS